MADTELTRHLSGIYRLTKGTINQQIAHLNVRATQSDLLLYANEYPHQTQKMIARANCVDPSLLARDLQLLEQRGWLVRTPDADDKRARRVTLTPAGH